MGATPRSSDFYATLAEAEAAASHRAAASGHLLQPWHQESEHATVRSLAACARCDRIIEIHADAQGFAPRGALLTAPCHTTERLN
jgi:hypothetical protein